MLQFIVCMIITFVLNKYYYGGLIFIYSLLVGFHTFLPTIVLSGIKINDYTHIPAYMGLVSLVSTSLFVLHKSSKELSQKMITVAQLSVAVLMSIFLKYGKSRFELLNEAYINIVPTLFLMGFFISVGILKDNQSILRKQYASVMYDDDAIKEY